jgi:hypothetical protein
MKRSPKSCLTSVTATHAQAWSRQTGASLLEGIAYLGIAALVLIGAVALLNTAFSSSNSNQLNQELSSIQTATRKLFMTTQGDFGTADITAGLIGAGGFPQTLTTNASAGTVTNVWGGAVTVTGVNADFTVQYTAVPKDVCINTLTATTSGWQSVTVGGTAVTLPATPTAANTACATTSNTIVWTSV